MNYYKERDWNVICDSCGKKLKASHTKHRWDGFIVCDSCWEPRHSHDFIKVKIDKQYVPFSRPQTTDTFTEVCNLATQSAYAGIGTANCSKAGQTFGMTYWELVEDQFCSIERKVAIAGVGYAGCAIINKNVDGYL